uniref:L-alanine-DL-glutamate epimerase n=1 Tax=Roseihalotalea indica TaxID=2867963 RepID=A0AA49GMH2_9BACT|nr:L-alanine-DL-glutamate epimerase [Tunicatimonas sp. TK19036]
MMHLNRRQFLRQSSAAASIAPLLSFSPFTTVPTKPKRVTLEQVSSNFEREPLSTPYGFKGGYMTNVWQTVARFQSPTGKHSIGLGTQNVLWSDAQVFLKHSENGGNALMYAMTEKAVQLAKGQTYDTPIDLLDTILEDVYAYGKKITDNPDLRKTFALNALVAVDNAAWLLYAYENGISDFDSLIPEAYRPALSHQHDKVVSVPAFSYATPVKQMKELVDEGYFFLKIKLGHPGTQREMLDKDKAKLTEIHKVIGQVETSHTKSGKIPYYFDMNGRYEEKESLLELLDHARSIGAFDQIVVVEEPFPEENEARVDDVGVRVAADESAHTEEDVLTRIEMGYQAIALKPIAKTLSMTLKMAKVAQEQNIPCLCADLTVNPILVDWNKNVAARLAAWDEFPGMGLMENNGHQNYRDWSEMLSYHPYADASWVQTKDGVFNLDDEFYQRGGGIFEMSDHYQALFNPKKGNS